MSVATDVTALYADRFLTVPVRFGLAVARGYLDHQSVVQTDGAGMSMQANAVTLQLSASAFATMPKADDQVYVGAVGQATATTRDTRYRVRQRDRVGDGLEVTLILTRA